MSAIVCLNISSRYFAIMALGELIIEDRGKITGQRVLDVEGPRLPLLWKENTEEKTAQK